MAGEYVRLEDLVIHQGDDRPFVWPVTDAQGQPIDLSGYSVKAQVRPRFTGRTLLHEWTTANGRASIASNKVTLKVSDSGAWDWRFGVYDIHLIDGNGNTEVLSRGTVTVIPGVTRADRQ